MIQLVGTVLNILLALYLIHRSASYTVIFDKHENKVIVKTRKNLVLSEENVCHLCDIQGI